MNLEDANLLLDPECLSLESWVGPEGIVAAQAAIVRTATYRWAFRWAVVLELGLLLASSLLSFALLRELKIYDVPGAH